MLLTSRNVLLPGAPSPAPATVIVDDDSGKITSVTEGYATRADYPHVSDKDWHDAGDRYIFPGFVDAHVHLNEPGRTDWEGFRTGTRAAASGGVTTVIDMPLNSIPPTTTVANFDSKRAAAKGQCWTDVGFWGGVIPGNHKDLVPLVDAGVRGFKCFLIESGVEEFPCVTESDLIKAIEEIKSSTLLMFHAELEDPSHTHVPPSSDSVPNPTHYSTFLESRPQSLEHRAIQLIISLQERYPSLRAHIVHLSAASALPLIRAAKTKSLSLTVETCYHYLCLNASSIPDGRPEFKCCPPIRDEENRKELWNALEDGTIDFVVSDHSPCVASLKSLDEGDYMSAWGGISTLGLGASLLWTEMGKAEESEGTRAGKITKWLSEKTAKHAGLSETKGAIREGYDADLVVFDPNESFTVTKESLNFKNKLTPYEGLSLSGRVKQTFLRGKEIYDSDVEGDAFLGADPIGRLL